MIADLKECAAVDYCSAVVVAAAVTEPSLTTCKQNSKGSEDGTASGW